MEIYSSSQSTHLPPLIAIMVLTKLKTKVISLKHRENEKKPPPPSLTETYKSERKCPKNKPRWSEENHFQEKKKGDKKFETHMKTSRKNYSRKKK